MMAVTELNFDPQAFLKQGSILTGKYKGGFLVAPAGALNWYFANIGLQPFVTAMRNEVATYIDLYLANLTTDLKIQDVTFSASGVPTLRASDSDDSYAATFLSLVAAYVQAPADIGWFNARLPKLLMMAERNLIANRYLSGLTYPFQSESQYDLAYLQDNCEVYRGIADLIDCLTRTNNTDFASYYTKALSNTLRGISSLYNQTTKSWWWDYYPNATHDVVQTKFYPDLVSQIFPQAYGVPVSVAAEDAGFAYLNRYAPGWPEGQCPNMPNSRCDPFPWAMLGYVAAFRGQVDLATRQIVHINTISQDSSQRGALTINELGWYQRTLNVLNAPPHG
jgi:hypothetical protein